MTKEITMSYKTLLLVFPLLFLTMAVAFAAPAKEFKNFKGTWMCPECAKLKQADTPAKCEAEGHQHALKLDDGEILTFIDSPRAAALVHGGGRDNARIEVSGFFDAQAKSLDIEAYRIDGLWSSWCDAHSRMDLCRSTGKPESERTETSSK
jgi:hypothetical protein